MSGLAVPANLTFYAGQPPTPQLNAMSQAFSFLLARVAFRARRAGAGTVARNAHTLIPWDSVDEDPYGGWAAGNPAAYTVQQSGWYICCGTVSLAGTGAAGTVLIPSLSINGSSPTGQGTVGWEGPEIFPPTGASDPKCVTALWEAYCIAGDQIALDCYVSNEPSANPTWQTTAGVQSRIELLWMSV
ncbi:hypothetical protein GCM10023196_036840 [Actinoallomurus vinaceus]|uniref:Chitin-binding type-3 domain-containing protein n=1 Tax=Actinoallomurus vinaceus TaxID=1080074 RepID=A0ABP8UAP7_9ACTN